MSAHTAELRISRFIAGEASGSDISVPGSGSGYSEQLAEELARVGARGGMVTLDAVALRDLAEWCDAMELANRDGGNQSGARACGGLATRARDLASTVDALDG